MFQRQRNEWRKLMNTSSKSPRLLRRSTGLLLGAGVVLTAAAASATPTVEMKTGVLLVKQSDPGKVTQFNQNGNTYNTGAGVMQANLIEMANNQIMTVWMDSDVQAQQQAGNDNSGWWQGKLSVVQLNQKGAPSVVVPPTQFTNFNGDRPFNHPSLAVDSTGKYVVVAFASSKDDQDNTQEYAMVLDNAGNVLVPAMHIGLQDDGNNTGATTISYTGVDGSGNARFMVGYQHNNNESYVCGLTLSASGTPALTQTFNTQFYQPTNIGRPVLAVLDTQTVTACTEVGNNRPPEYGIGCAVINSSTGAITYGGGNEKNGNGQGGRSSVTNGIVVASNVYDGNGNPVANPQYMNQTTLAYIGKDSSGNDMCALGVNESNGAGKNTNRGGANLTHAYTINCRTLAVISNTSPTEAVAPWQRHATLLTTEFGNQGQIYAAHIGCSETGAGSAAVQMVPIDNKSGLIGSIDKNAQLLPVSWLCDSALLSNKGLRNPTDQGRDFVNAISAVKNPGYQVPGGWMPEAKLFMVTTVPFVDGVASGTSNYPGGGGGNGQGGGNGGGGGNGAGTGGGGGTGTGTTETYTRNSLHLSFLPIAWDPAVQVVMSAALDATQIPAGSSPCVANCPGSTGSGSGTGGGSSFQIPGDNPSGTGGSGGTGTLGAGNHMTFGTTGSSGCNVAQTPGSNDKGELAGALALVGLVVVSRRRRS